MQEHVSYSSKNVYDSIPYVSVLTKRERTIVDLMNKKLVYVPRG